MLRVALYDPETGDQVAGFASWELADIFIERTGDRYKVVGEPRDVPVREPEQMRVVFRFSAEKIRCAGYRWESIRDMIRLEFDCAGLVELVTSTPYTLVFQDRGRESDYSAIWKILLVMIEESWFNATIKEAYWLDDEEMEDLLIDGSHAGEKRIF